MTDIYFPLLGVVEGAPKIVVSERSDLFSLDARIDLAASPGHLAHLR